MKEKEFERIVKELERGKRELMESGISFKLVGRKGDKEWRSETGEHEFIYFDEETLRRLT